MKKYRRQPVSFLLAAWLLFLAGLSGCTVATASPTPLPPAPELAEAVSPHAQIQFTANTPYVEFDPAAETILYLEILNDPAGAGAQSER
ncbi:MAG: hypothetical protein AAGU05_16240, partial [Anaerolineaceae bacterium]